MKAKTKVTPKFKSEAEERAFWERPDSTDHLDLTKMRRTSFPNLKPTTQSISLRLPLSMLERIKVEANARDVPYQSLIKIWLDEKLSA
jgi:predicted DNA binding CopG/RHH family protein